jgi:hypothetical protein
MRYVIVLDTNNGDFFQSLDKGQVGDRGYTWGSAYSIYKATPFQTRDEAKAVMEDLMIKSLYPKAVIQAADASFFTA